MNTILSAVRKDGNVLLAVDTAGRVLELAQVRYLMARDSLTYITKKHMNPSPKKIIIQNKHKLSILKISPPIPFD